MPIKQINECLKKWFDFPENKIYCQVATLGDGNPHIRTMRIYQITTDGNIILLTDTATKKWGDLKKCAKVAICMAEITQGQIVIEGEALLNTAKTNAELTKIYWNDFLDQTWRDYYISRTPDTAQFIDGIPLSFGVISLQPNYLEILQLDLTDFLKSSKTQYRKKGDEWQTQVLFS